MGHLGDALLSKSLG